MMKKTATILTVLAVVGLIAGVAFAGPWGGARGGYNQGYGPGANAGPCYNSQNFGPQHQAFLDETADLRHELAGKRGEYHALMAHSNPDPKQAARLQQEMNSIREQIRAKARDRGINAPVGTRGYGGRGYHRGGRCW
ncbi:MAG: periplasmic heavy metal sensor [Desulfobacteraceae bacterium]|nr:periplasmic heavy metal sensor [Desulfobacteraceae bacterium]